MINLSHLKNAQECYNGHKSLIDNMVSLVTLSYPPVNDLDIQNPYSWKPENWKWFLRERGMAR